VTAGNRPERRVFQTEALAFLASHPSEPRTSVVTSLPDLSETPHLDLEGWQQWFVDAVRRVVAWVPDGGVAIFYQSDIRYEGRVIDKGYLVMRGAEPDGALLWHKIVCRKPPGTLGFGRPSYSHMICIQRGLSRRAAVRHPGPEVLADAGFMPWSRAMGVGACRVALQFVRDETDTRLVVDPFCGQGTVLAVANAMGFDALGIDLATRRCQVARTLQVEAE
jgi:hypothetical protein